MSKLTHEGGASWGTLFASRHLLLALVVREYQLRYRQSFVGLLWAFILPIATLGAGTLVFKTIVGVESPGGSYEVSTLAAIVPWTLFASGLTFGVGSIVQQKSMVTKLAFP